jgi:hypothetical protein
MTKIDTSIVREGLYIIRGWGGIYIFIPREPNFCYRSYTLNIVHNFPPPSSPREYQLVTHARIQPEEGVMNR